MPVHDPGGGNGYSPFVRIPFIWIFNDSSAGKVNRLHRVFHIVAPDDVPRLGSSDA